MSMDWLPIDLLWRGALVIVPLALLVTVICGLFPCRPSTRHAMWLVVLVILVASPFVPRFDYGQLPAGPPADLVWTVALQVSEKHLVSEPERALSRLEGLPVQDPLDPKREELAKIVYRGVRAAIVQVEGAPRRLAR